MNKNIPSFFHVGYGRAASTWMQNKIFTNLSEVLLQDNSQEWYIKNAKSKSELKKHFIEKSNIKYLLSEESFTGNEFRDFYEIPEKLYWVNPNAKILIVIRSQFTVIQSYYYLYLKKGGILSFSDYLRIIIENKKFNYLELYNSYKNFFGKNVKILLFEDFLETPKLFVNEIIQWLELKNKFDINDYNKINKSPNYSNLILLKLLNKFLGISKIPRGYSPLLSYKYENKIKLRRRLLKIVSQLNYIFNLIFFKKKLKLSNYERDLLIENYGESNMFLFKKLNKKISSYHYPRN